MHRHLLPLIIAATMLWCPSVAPAASTDASLARKLRMAGYRSDEIQDVIAGKRTLEEIKTNIRRKLLGLKALQRPITVAAPNGSRQAIVTVAKPYLRAVKRAAHRHGVAPALILAVIQAESAFRAAAVSSRGAVGLMQLMPDTADALGISDPFDPIENISGGTRYLSYCLARFGNTGLALAAYNAGPERVSAHGGLPPWRETRQYVQRVLAFERYFRQHVSYW